jgi:hypothetical protein
LAREEDQHEQQRQRPGDSVRDDLERADMVEQLEIERHHPPEQIGGKPEPEPRARLAFLVAHAGEIGRRGRPRDGGFAYRRTS